MVSDVLGPSAEVAAPEPEPVSQTPEPEPAAAQEPQTFQPEVVASSGQTPAQVPPTTPAVFRVGNRDYTAQEIEAAFTSAQQLPHLQNKYMQALEASRQPQQQPQGQQQAQQPQQTPQAYVEQIRQKYDPVVKKYAEAGVMSQDFVTLFPTEAAQMAYYEDRFSRAEQVMKTLAADTQQRYQREQSQGYLGEVTNAISQVAQSGEAFAALKDPAKTTEFFNFIWNLNPTKSQAKDPAFLATQYFAFNKDQYLQTAQQKQVQTQRSQQARLARADATGGTRAPGVMSSPDKSPLDEMVEDFLDRSNG
jgi:hypothetical protein